MKKNYKIFALLIFITFFSLITHAKQMQERRIYYLDCSYSMVKPNQLWNPVCDDLVKAINSVQDGTTELVVIPFAVDDVWHATLDAFSAKADSKGKAFLVSKIKELKPSPKSMTYHSETLNDFYYNNRIDGNRVNYVFIMTDGRDEESPSKFPSLLKRWQGLFGNEHVYGFYVMLHQSAQNDQVSQIISNTDHLWEVQTANVNINLVRPDDKATLLVRDGLGYVDVPVYGDLSNVSFSVMGSSSNYSASKCEKQDGKIRIFLNVPRDLAVVPEEETCVVELTMQGGKYDLLLVDKISVKCANKKIKAINPRFK